MNRRIHMSMTLFVDVTVCMYGSEMSERERERDGVRVNVWKGVSE